VSDRIDPTAARIPVSEETRDRVKQAKRGGETYDSVLRKMLVQYDPDNAADLTVPEDAS
jgi:hypothetical protein